MRMNRAAKRTQATSTSTPRVMAWGLDITDAAQADTRSHDTEDATTSVCTVLYTIEFQDGLGDWLPLAPGSLTHSPRRALVMPAVFMSPGAAAEALAGLNAARDQAGRTTAYRVIRWGPSGRTATSHP